MKKILVMALFLILATGSFAYLYDGLNTNNSLSTPGVPNALHAHVGFYYQGILNKAFNNDSESYDFFSTDNPDVSDSVTNMEGSLYAMAVPLTVGYNVKGIVEVNVTALLVKNSANFSGTAGSTSIDMEGSGFGLGDLWISAKGIFQIGPQCYFGPRIAFKAGIGEDDPEVDDPDTEIPMSIGDGQHDIDFGVWFGRSRDGDRFRSNANIGLRYRLAKTTEETENGVTTTTEETPGMEIYARALPGFAITPEFEAYLVLDFVYGLDNKLDPEPATPDPIPDDYVDPIYSTMGLAVGVAPAYYINDNNMVSAEVQYPVMGKNVQADLMFGVNYDGYIPF